MTPQAGIGRGFGDALKALARSLADGGAEEAAANARRSLERQWEAELTCERAIRNVAAAARPVVPVAPVVPAVARPARRRRPVRHAA